MRIGHRGLWVGVAFGLVIVVALVSFELFVLRERARANRIRANVGLLVREIASQRWVRPVLRMPEVDQNAAGFLGPRRPRHGGPEGGRPDEHVDLNDLRALTHGRYALSEFLVGDTPFGREVGPGQHQLLAAAATATPGECLQMSADAIRSMQDHIVPLDLMGARWFVPIAVQAVQTARSCAANASPEERSQAAREFRVLVDHSNSIGDMLRAQIVFEVQQLMSDVSVPAGLPITRNGIRDLRYLDRTEATCEALLREMPRWGRLTNETPEGIVLREVRVLEGRLRALDLGHWNPNHDYEPEVVGYFAALRTLRETARWLAEVVGPPTNATGTASREVP